MFAKVIGRGFSAFYEIEIAFLEKFEYCSVISLVGEWFPMVEKDWDGGVNKVRIMMSVFGGGFWLRGR